MQVLRYSRREYLSSVFLFSQKYVGQVLAFFLLSPEGLGIRGIGLLGIQR